MQGESRQKTGSRRARGAFYLLGIFLLAMGVSGSGWAIRAALANRQYGALLTLKMESEAEMRLARRLFRLSPRHYAVCIRAADTAFRTAEAQCNPELARTWREEARFWVSRGLNLNPWLMELHYLKARLAAVESPAAGVDAWKSYVDWHFWDPVNLEHLARFQEAAGQIEAALETLEWLRPWPRYNAWRDALLRSFQKTAAGEGQRDLPPIPVGNPEDRPDDPLPPYGSGSPPHPPVPSRE